MQIVSNLSTLRPEIAYWVPAVTAPSRNWTGSPGCRRGARFLIDAISFRPSHEHFPVFENRAECLRWIMEHRLALSRGAPAAAIHAVSLTHWMLGVDAG